MTCGKILPVTYVILEVCQFQKIGYYFHRLESFRLSTVGLHPDVETIVLNLFASMQPLFCLCAASAPFLH